MKRSRRRSEKKKSIWEEPRYIFQTPPKYARHQPYATEVSHKVSLNYSHIRFPPTYSRHDAHSIQCRQMQKAMSHRTDRLRTHLSDGSCTWISYFKRRLGAQLTMSRNWANERACCESFCQSGKSSDQRGWGYTQKGVVHVYLFVPESERGGSHKGASSTTDAYTHIHTHTQ